MFYGNTIEDTRQLFFVSWQKHKSRQPLLSLESQLVDVISIHPEYHQLLESNAEEQRAFFAELGEANPFLHMGLHLTIRDQLATNRPAGFAAVFQALLNKYGDKHTVEHLIMEPLAECLWQAQRDNTLPNEANYLHACKLLVS